MKSNGKDRACSTYGGGEDIYDRLTLKGMFKWWDGTWTGLSWLRIVTDGGLL